MHKLLIAAALVIGLCGCSTLNSAINNAPQTVSQAEQGLTLAHLAYQGLGDALKSAADSRLLKGAAAAQAKSLYDQAGAALDTADTADGLANAKSMADAVSQANALIIQAKALINPQVTK